MVVDTGLDRMHGKPLVSLAWQAERARIADAANKKRSEKAKAQPRTESGEFQPVVEQSVPPPAKKHKARQSKSTASKTNAGAVARGDKLAKERPDLAEKARGGPGGPGGIGGRVLPYYPNPYSVQLKWYFLYSFTIWTLNQS